MPTVLVKDFGRRFRNTGYGQLSRSVSLSLKGRSDVDVVFSAADISAYSEGIPAQEALDEIPVIHEASYNYDVMLVVSPPRQLPETIRPKILYTQNALGDLKTEWAGYLSSADTIVVPGEFDRRVFSKYHDYVEICHQVVDYNFFRPYPRYRPEGPEALSFLFVGSFSFRKGVDLVSKVFSTAFKKFGLVECEVHLHCFSGLEGGGVNQLIELARALPSEIKISASNGPITLPWMRRKLNRFDVVFTFSRGEGWCMPLWEALYSGIPVVAPQSTAMGEYLPRRGVCFFDTNELNAQDVNLAFGDSFKAQYGEPNITYFEPDVESAAAAIATAAQEQTRLKAEAAENRELLAELYSYESMGRLLEKVITDTLKRQRS